MTTCVRCVPCKLVIILVKHCPSRQKKHRDFVVSRCKIMVVVLPRQIFVIASNSRLLKAINDYQFKFIKGFKCAITPLISSSVYLVE